MSYRAFDEAMGIVFQWNGTKESFTNHIVILPCFMAKHTGSLPIIILQINTYISTKMVIGNVNNVVTFFTTLNLNYIHATLSFLSQIARIMKPCNDYTIYPL